MKTILKILLIGIITTFCRIIGQMLIPDGTQTVLEPSVFVIQGTMPIAFCLYGAFAYSIIASLFLLIRDNLSGNKLIKGLKYGVSCSAIWIIYLFEPLPHVSSIDKITYPLADGIALVVMGLLLGLFLGQTTTKEKKPYPFSKAIVSLLTITVLFVAGRMLQYLILHIYSSFDIKASATVLWSVITGFVISVVLLWLSQYIDYRGRIHYGFIIGVVLFGVDLLLFNFFMPLVFDANIPDLIVRTLIDVITVTVGCFFLPQQNKRTV